MVMYKVEPDRNKSRRFSMLCIGSETLPIHGRHAAVSSSELYAAGFYGIDHGIDPVIHSHFLVDVS